MLTDREQYIADQGLLDPATYTRDKYPVYSGCPAPFTTKEVPPHGWLVFVDGEEIGGCTSYLDAEQVYLRWKRDQDDSRAMSEQADRAGGDSGRESRAAVLAGRGAEMRAWMEAAIWR